MPLPNWCQCPGHVWKEYESEYTNEYHTQVRCIVCRCPGERDEKTGDVYWPAT